MDSPTGTSPSMYDPANSADRASEYRTWFSALRRRGGGVRNVAHPSGS